MFSIYLHRKNINYYYLRSYLMKIFLLPSVELLILNHFQTMLPIIKLTNPEKERTCIDVKKQERKNNLKKQQ